MQTCFINAPKSCLHCESQRQTSRGALIHRTMFFGVGVFVVYIKKKKGQFIEAVAPRSSALSRTIFSRVQYSKRSLFAGLAYWRVIFLNIRKSNGVSCPGFAPTLFCRPASLSYSVQKWNAKKASFLSVLLPILCIFRWAQFSAFVIPM